MVRRDDSVSVEKRRFAAEFPVPPCLLSSYLILRGNCGDEALPFGGDDEEGDVFLVPWRCSSCARFIQFTRGAAAGDGVVEFFVDPNVLPRDPPLRESPLPPPLEPLACARMLLRKIAARPSDVCGGESDNFCCCGNGCCVRFTFKV